MGWFALVNVALLALVGLRYLWYYATLGPSVAWIYALLAFVGQMSAFAFVPMLCLVPVILLLPRPRLVQALGVMVGSAVLSLLVLDSLLFAENRYHIGVLTFTLLEPATWAFLALYFLVALAIEAMLAQWVWTRTERLPRRRIGRYIALAIVVCFVSSHLIHLWAEAHFYVPVTSFTRYLPWFSPLRDSRRLVKLGLVDQARAREESMAATLAGRPGDALRYPQAPLRCGPRPPLLNVMLIVIDGMRADALAPASAPRLSALAPVPSASTSTGAAAMSRDPACSPSSTVSPPRTGRSSPRSRSRPCSWISSASTATSSASSRARPCTAAWSGSTGRPSLISRTCVSRPSRPIRARADATGP